MERNDLQYKVYDAVSKEVKIQTNLLVFYLVQGQLSIRYQEENNRLSRGDVLVINPGSGYTILAPSHALLGEAAYSMPFLSSIVGGEQLLFHGNSAKDVDHSYQALQDILFTLTADYAADPHRTQCVQYAKLLLILDELVEHFQVRPQEKTTGEAGQDQRMRQIMAYIFSNLDQEISLNQLADDMYVSPSTLSRLFRKSTGMYFADYVTNIRVQMAMEMLEHTQQTMTRISLACGFQNVSSFNRAFHTVTGMAPSAYRESRRKNAALASQQQHNSDEQIRLQLQEDGYLVGDQKKPYLIELDLDTVSGLPSDRTENKSADGKSAVPGNEHADLQPALYGDGSATSQPDLSAAADFEPGRARTSDAPILRDLQAKTPLPEAGRNPPAFHRTSRGTAEEIYEGSFDRTGFSERSRTLPRIWDQMINIGPVWDLNNANVQYHILYLHEQLHFTAFRVWNIFSRKMMIADEHSRGSYNYSVVDMALDFLVSHHLTPFIDFGNRPDMAYRSIGDTVYYENQYISFDSRQSWQRLIEDILTHFADRYGLAEISRWTFELSRDEEHQSRLYQDKNYDYFDAFSFFCRCIHRIAPGAKAGGIGDIAVKDWDYMLRLLQRCKEHDIRPDFVTLGLFGKGKSETGSMEEGSARGLSGKGKSEDGSMKEGSIPGLSGRRKGKDGYAEQGSVDKGACTDPADLSADDPSLDQKSLSLVVHMRQLLAQAGFPDLPLYITEWNITPSNRNYLNDSCYRAACFIREVTLVGPYTDLIGIMSGTDWVSSYVDSAGLVNGGIGILTKDMIRKPVFFAVDFLNGLGTDLLGMGDHFIATKDERGEIQILLFYRRWSSRNAYLGRKDSSLRQYRSMTFTQEQTLPLEIKIDHVLAGSSYVIRKKTLNHRSGSILDEWKQFDYDTRLRRDDIRYLLSSSIPNLSLWRDKTAAGEEVLTVKVLLEPDEISLVQIYSRK